jgi:DNA-binding transcriptional MerR regulator
MRNENDTKYRARPQHSQHYGAKEVCKTVGISHRQLDYWVLIGVVSPHLERHGAKMFRRFNRHDVTVLLRIKQLIDEGVVVSRAAERVHREMQEAGQAMRGVTLDAAGSPDSTGNGDSAQPVTPDGQEQDSGLARNSVHDGENDEL